MPARRCPHKQSRRRGIPHNPAGESAEQTGIGYPLEIRMAWRHKSTAAVDTFLRRRALRGTATASVCTMTARMLQRRLLPRGVDADSRRSSDCCIRTVSLAQEGRDAIGARWLLSSARALDESCCHCDVSRSVNPQASAAGNKP